MNSKRYYKGERVYHCKSWRAGTVQKFYKGGQNAGKMWILFDDGWEELRWAHRYWTLRSVDDWMTLWTIGD